MSSNSQEDIKPMVQTYKRLFLVLSVITLIGIAVVLLHVPLWIVFLIGFAFMILKSFLVYESFKKFITGRNAVVILFFLTISFLIGLVTLPVLNHHGYIVGTEDISKKLLMEESAKEEGHHAH